MSDLQRVSPALKDENEVSMSPGHTVVLVDGCVDFHMAFCFLRKMNQLATRFRVLRPVIHGSSVCELNRRCWTILSVEGLDKQPCDDASTPIQLNEEQRHVLRMAVSDRRPSFFLTGQAGTGKSVLLREIISQLQHLHAGNKKSDLAIAVCAPTGIAANNIDGMTIHSWGGIDPVLIFDSRPVEAIAKKLTETIRKLNRPALKRWRGSKVLVIDECSMVHPKLLDLLDVVARKIRCVPKPFGGLQVILCGDLMQLPPVSLGSHHKQIKDETCKYTAIPGLDLRCKHSHSNSTGNLYDEFCFDSRVWPIIAKNTFELRTILRQGNDALFCELLNYLRNFERSINDRRLFPAVDAILRILKTPFNARTSYPFIFEETLSLPSLLSKIERCRPHHPGLSKDDFLDQSYQFQQQPIVGNLLSPSGPTTFICSTNFEVEAVNTKSLRTLGTPITEYLASDGVILARDNFQLDHVEMDSIDDSELTSPKTLALAVGAKVMLTRNLSVALGLTNGCRGEVVGFSRRDSQGISYPHVRFPAQIVEVRPYLEQDLVPKSGASIYGNWRYQLPLRLAYALTVHRCQGQTLNQATISLRNTFQFGQLYTSLTRVKSLSGLRIVGYDDTTSQFGEIIRVRDQLWKLMRHPRIPAK